MKALLWVRALNQVGAFELYEPATSELLARVTEGERRRDAPGRRGRRPGVPAWTGGAGTERWPHALDRPPMLLAAYGER